MRALISVYANDYLWKKVRAWRLCSLLGTLGMIVLCQPGGFQDGL